MNFYDVLAAEKMVGGIPTTNFFDLLFAQFISGEKWKIYEGTLPAALNANGADMRQYQIYGNTGGVGDEVDITGLSEPLCGIGTYTDSLDLSTGLLTRKIKKLVLTGKENWINRSGDPPNTFFIENSGVNIVNKVALCTHYLNQNSDSFADLEDKHLLIRISSAATKWFLGIRDSSFPTGNPSVAILKSYLAAQYAAETPVTVWYALAEPEVSAIAVPSGLTGTLEGYLIQDGTPTPETPIYPTANGVKQADNTYSIDYGYKLDMSVSDGTNTTITPIYIGDTALQKDEYIDYQAQKVYRMINGVLTPTDPPAPFPALPTVDGEMIVDYAGQSVAPEKVYFEYKGGYQP